MSVHRKDIEMGMETNKFLSGFRAFNDFLEGVPTMVVKFFNRIFATETGIPQKGVDMICEWSSWKVNIMVETARQFFLRSMFNENKYVRAIVKPIETFQKFLKDPLGSIEEIGDCAKNMLDRIVGPIAKVYIFIEQLIVEIGRLAANLTNLLSVLPPTPPSSDINFDKFQLKIETVTMSTILSDPSNLPSPEEMFPEPIIPFSKEYFQALGSEAKVIYREEKPFYKPKNDSDFLTLEELANLSGVNLNEGNIDSIITGEPAAIIKDTINKQIN